MSEAEEVMTMLDQLADQLGIQNFSELEDLKLMVIALMYTKVHLSKEIKKLETEIVRLKDEELNND